MLRFNLLISYWYFSRLNLDQWVARSPWPIDLLADSGAFSAFNQNDTIDIAAYADWLHQWKHLFASYINLDVKGDWRQSVANQRWLEDRGLKPLPVYHAGEPWEMLQDMAAEYDYIGIGGVAGSMHRNASLVRFMLKCHEVAGDGVVFHGLGVTSWPMLVNLPYYSVDSSSWMAGPRFGRFSIFDPLTGEWFKLELGSPDIYHHAGLIRRYGFDPDELFEAKKNRAVYFRNTVKALTALSYLEAEGYLRKLHGPITCSYGEGLKLYLADASDEHVLSCIPEMEKRRPYADPGLFHNYC